MVIFILYPKSKPNITGFLKNFLYEIKPKIFIGRLNNRIKKLVWQKVCENTDSAILIFEKQKVVNVVKHGNCCSLNSELLTTIKVIDSNNI